MGTEIERKFLVTGTKWKMANSTYFCQGYLNRDKNRTVRIRLAENKAWLTIKGKSNGPVRPEFEYAIPVADAQALLAICEQPLIEKNRFISTFAGMTWEIDEFLGQNSGLVIAEIELSSPEQEFAKPDWVGAEVTDDPKYYNSNLSKSPYSTW